MDKRKRKYLSGSFRRKIWDKFNRICNICGCETRLFGNTYSPIDNRPIPCAIDHIVPFSKGGECECDNFQLLCITCNSQKGVSLD